MPTTGVDSLRGLGLPALRRSGGYFASKNKYDVAFSDLMHAVLTPIGSRPMRRSFGSALHLVLFEPNNITTEALIDRAVRAACTAFCPHLYIVRVIVQPVDDEIAMGVQFGLVEERVDQERVVLLTDADTKRLLAARSTV